MGLIRRADGTIYMGDSQTRQADGSIRTSVSQHTGIDVNKFIADYTASHGHGPHIVDEGYINPLSGSQQAQLSTGVKPQDVSRNQQFPVTPSNFQTSTTNALPTPSMNINTLQANEQGMDREGIAARANALVPPVGTPPKVSMSGTGGIVQPNNGTTLTSPVNATTGSGAPTKASSGSTDYMAQILKYMVPGQDETNTQQQIDDLTTSAKMGVNSINGEPIPYQTKYGTAKNIEDQARTKVETLSQKLSRLQAARQSSLNVSQFSLDRADKQAADAKEELRYNQDLANTTAKNSAPAILAQLSTLSDQKAKDAFVEKKAKELGVSIDSLNSLLQAQIGQGGIDLKQYPASYQEYLLAKQSGYNGSYNDYQDMDANRKAVRSTTNNIINDESKTFDLQVKQAPAQVAALKAQGLSWQDTVDYLQKLNIPINADVEDALQRNYRTPQEYSNWKLLNK